LPPGSTLYFSINPLANFVSFEETPEYGGITHYNHDGMLALDLRSQAAFFADCLCQTKAKQILLEWDAFLKGIGKVDTQAVSEFLHTGFFEGHAQFQVGDGVGCHHQFKAKQTLDEVVIDVRLASALPAL